MDINFNNIGIGNGAYGIGDQAKVDGTKVEGQKTGGHEVRLSAAQSFDVIRGSEPIAEVPDSALTRDDELGRLVSSAFNFPPPAMPEFKE
jgi:hypothetical protein